MPEINLLVVFYLDNILDKLLINYYNYTDNFFSNLTIEFLENTNINKYIIELIDSKQLFYKLIYIFSLVELKILKTYIKTFLKIRFIISFKFLASAFILLNKKPNSNLYLCINY